MESPGEVLYVTPGIGPFKNIQEALSIAKPGSSIVVSPGLYTRPIKINKPDITIRAKEINGEVQISVSNGPIVTIDIPEGKETTIKGFKFIHSAEKREELTHDDWISSPKLNNSFCTAVLMKGGNCNIIDCTITLGCAKVPMPAVIAVAGSLNIANTEIKGNSEVESVGVICKDANITLQECKIFKHMRGGVILNNSPAFSSMIYNCSIFRNKLFGILCEIEDSEPMIQQNTIMQIEGPAIKISNGSIPHLLENEIKYNELGIEILNSCPKIIRNHIKYNFGNGIQMRSTLSSCEPKIEENTILENENGILCIGDLCNPDIIQNTLIANNRKAGIRLEEDSHAKIIYNEIAENLTQGILLVTGCSARIDSNSVHGNLRANIAIGAGSTFITNNKIYNGRCEGIFVLDASNIEISGNEIYENNDGILSVDSYIDIKNNKIHSNMRTGITLAGKKRDNAMNSITQNELFKNTEVGIYIRDNAEAEVFNNRSYNNGIQISIIARGEWDTNKIKADNSFEGELQLPFPKMCNIL